MWAPATTIGMRIIHYNILDGCQGDAPRLKGVQEWLARQQADVAGLVELNGWNVSPGLAAWAGACGFGHSHLFVRRSRYLIGIIARQPIEVIEEISDGMHHGILHTRVAGVHYVNTHFAPHDRLMRVHEARTCAAIAARVAEPLVLMGDLNSHSPADRDLCESFLTPENRDWALDFEPQQILLDAGLVDLVDRQQPLWTVATDLRPDEPKRRLDYIYANRAFLADHSGARSRVIRGEEVAKLSDHFPLICEA